MPSSYDTAAPAGSGIEHILGPHLRDLGGGLTVQRMLPVIERRTVGPFVFLDQMGPIEVRPEMDIDVRPHPHIGLATVTYLFAGEVLHRDSIGSVRAIRPGAVNWMTAGRGIVHSERRPAELRDRAYPLFGMQFWVGLPLAAEESEPSFVHADAADLPEFDLPGGRLRLVLGELEGRRSPVPTASRTLLAELMLADGVPVAIPAADTDRAVQLASGTVEVAGMQIQAPRLIVPRAGAQVTLTPRGPVRAVLFGGEPLDGERHLYWNFVSSSRERIERAKTAWREQSFPRIPGETEFIPLPP